MLPSLSQQCKGREAPSGVGKHSRATKATPKVSLFVQALLDTALPPCHLGEPSRADPWRFVHPKICQDLPEPCTGSATSGSPSLWGQLVPALPAALAGSPLQENHSPLCPAPPSQALCSTPGKKSGKIPAFPEVPGAALVPGCLCSRDCTAWAVRQ